ncbi:MAG: hypothetical protein QW827_04680 [Candidatus Bathyarchaeia archaeon]
MIINTGGRDVVIDKITVRGQTVEWDDVYYVITKGGISQDLIYIEKLVDGANTTIPDPHKSNEFLLLQKGEANKDLTLRSGYTIIIYMDRPDSLSMNDIGLTVGITVFTSNAQYYKEANVEAAP